MTARGQLAAIARMALRSALNNLARRQGNGALVVFPILVAFLLVELARFGSRATAGMLRVLSAASPERGLYYASFWLTWLAVAVAALKYARVVPARGARPFFDTAALRALPVSPSVRASVEFLVGLTHAVGFVLLVWVPSVWGVARHARGVASSLLVTATSSVALDVVATMAAMAAHALFSRGRGGRALDAVRVVVGIAGFGLVAIFAAVGPIAAAGARSLRTSADAPSWAPWVPLRGFVALTLGHGDARSLALTVVTFVAPALLAAWVLARRGAGEVSLDAPMEPIGEGRWEAGLAAWRVELRMLLRQVPYLAFATPAFLVFFAALARGARAATGAELPPVVLMGLTGWSFVVMGTAFAGAASRRWRRVLQVPLTHGADPTVTVRAMAAAHTALSVGIALSCLALLLHHPTPGPWFFARMLLGLAATIAVGQWTQSAAVFLMIDPSPDRLTGLSVAGLFGVLASSAPTAAMIVMLSATPLPTWLSLLALQAMFTWAMERAAVARLRWIRDPDGDPDAALRAWPAMRTFGLGLMVQVLVMQLLEVAGTSGAPALVLGYVAFAAVMLPLGWRAWRRHAVTPRWSLAQSVAAGLALGVANFAVGSGYARVARAVWGDARGPLTAALASAPGLWRPALVLCAALLGPLSEELFFRGWLQQALRRELEPARPWVAVVLTAMAFAVMHAGEAWPTSLLAGLVAGAAMARSGRVETSAVMHVTSNALVMYAALSS